MSSHRSLVDPLQLLEHGDIFVLPHRVGPVAVQTFVPLEKERGEEAASGETPNAEAPRTVVSDQTKLPGFE